MSRRWKIGIALAVVGLAGFLVWAILSPATPPLTIRFVGYKTNHAFRLTEDQPGRDGSVFAVFAVTNQTGRTFVTHVTCLSRTNGVEVGQAVIWFGSLSFDSVLGADFPLLKAAAGGLAEVRIYRTDEPLRAVVEGRYYHRAKTRLDHYWSRMPWNQRTFSISATNECVELPILLCASVPRWPIFTPQRRRDTE